MLIGAQFHLAVTGTMLSHLRQLGSAAELWVMLEMKKEPACC